MITFTDILNELKKYTAFFDEHTDIFQDTSRGITRRWRYSHSENSCLAGAPVFILEPYDRNFHRDCTLFDYSDILTVDITKDNYKDYLNNVEIRTYKLGSLTISKMKQILENNAKAAIVAEKLEGTIEKIASIEEMF